MANQSIWLINVFASKKNKDYSVKNEFFDSLELVFDSLLWTDLKMVPGNFRAKMGKELAY